MNSSSRYFLAFSILLMFMLVSYAKAQDNCTKIVSLNKQKSLSTVRLNINNISTTFQNDGTCDAGSPNGGFEYPRGSGKIAVFVSGLLWGAKSNSIVNVGGSQYWSGLKPGRIISKGFPENSNNPGVRIFRVRPDYRLSDFKNEIELGEGTFDEIKKQYEKDWNEWPGNIGAPFEDKNGNGIYESLIDIPGYPNSAQTVWYVANDLDVTAVKNLFGSAPIGVEIQFTAWAYNSTDPLRNTSFRKYRMINKSGINLSDVYFCIFADIDIGSNGQLSGCDSTLSLGYGYARASGDKLYGDIIPAVGVSVVQGPLINGSVGDVGIFNGKKYIGKKNLPMTAFFHFLCGDTAYTCPIHGQYDGSIAYYNYFHGIEGLKQRFFKVPQKLGGMTTKFTFSGDPITGTGWIDGVDTRGTERYENIVTGPFNLPAGEVQEVVFAMTGAFGNNRLDAIRVLREYSKNIGTVYTDSLYSNGKIIVGVAKENISGEFFLSQNYPNPFNPTTTINWQIAKASHVTLKVFDLLGKEVATLVDEFKQPGNYSSSFLGRQVYQLPSGCYFYILKAGNYQSAKKMLLIK